MGKRELVALLKSSWCLVMVERLFLAVPRSCLRFVIVVFPDHTHLLFSGLSDMKAWLSHMIVIICMSIYYCALFIIVDKFNKIFIFH